MKSGLPPKKHDRRAVGEPGEWHWLSLPSRPLSCRLSETDRRACNPLLPPPGSKACPKRTPRPRSTIRSPPIAPKPSSFLPRDSYDGPSGAFFGVSSGAIKLSISHHGGKEAILVVVEPGNWSGAGPTLDRCARGHNPTALMECEIRVVTAMSFAALMQRNEFAQAIIARQMAQRLRLAYRSMGATALLSTRERILRLLTVLAYRGVTLAEDRKQSVSTSQEMWALMLGVSRATLNKEIHAL